MNTRKLKDYYETIYREGGHNELDIEEHVPDFPAPQGPNVFEMLNKSMANRWREEGRFDPEFGNNYDCHAVECCLNFNN